MVNLAHGFAERSLNVDLVLASAEGPYLQEVPPEVRVVDLGAKRVLYSLPGLVRYLRRERPVAMLSSLSHANIIALWARWLAGVPLRLIIREANSVKMSSSNASNLREKLNPFLMRLFYPPADGVIAISQGIAEDLIDIIGVSAEKVKVIYNPAVTPELFSGAEESLDHPWFAPGEPPVILGVGRLAKQKDFPTLISAFALVRKERPARLIILGEGVERLELESLVRELGVEKDVALPGFEENPYKFMNRAAIFVLSSRWEGLGNVLIQALALGKPVVSTDCPSGPAEILEGGKWGDLVPVGDPVALADTILAGLQEKSSISRSSNCQEYVNRRFGLDHIISAYLQMLLGEI